MNNSQEIMRFDVHPPKKFNMHTKTIPILSFLLGSACTPCNDNPFTENVACDGESCIAVTGGNAETGGDEPDATCTPYTAPEYKGQFMFCDGVKSKGEHCLQSYADALHITDYAFESSSATYAVKFDFMPIPPINDPEEPGADWWTWSKNYLTALPGVITHEDSGKVYAGYVSRGCCAQTVVDGSLERPPHNSECGSGYALQDTPRGWCLSLQDGTAAGLCVYPCDGPNDCPNPAGEFCDTTRPDPYGLGAGVCRYGSMESIPTPETEIGN